MPDHIPSLKELLPLTHLSFLILLTLAREDLHGYAIIKEVLNQSGGGLDPGTGTFYSALRRMKGELMIEEVETPVGSDGVDQRRRYYAITDLGRQALQAEAKRLESLVSRVRSLELLPGESG